MRNHVLYSIIGMAALFLVNGCQEPVVEPPVLTMSTTEFTAPAAGGDVTVAYKVANPVEGSTVEVVGAEEYSWVEVTSLTPDVVLTVGANDTGAERTAEFTMSYPGAADECEFTLVQAADESPSPGGNDFTLKAAYIDEYSYSAGESSDCFNFYLLEEPMTEDLGFVPGSACFVLDMYSAPGSNGVLPAGEYVLGDSMDPGVFNASNSMVSIYDEENPVVLMFTDGTISVSTDGENYTVDINVTCEDGESYHAVYNGPLDFGGGEPEPGFEYTLNPNWSVRYAGRHVTEEGVADWIAVDVESTEEQDLYFTAVWDAESYETYGIEYIVEAEIANMNALYGEYWVMFFTRYSSVEDDPWMPFDSGEYYAFAIGVDGDGNPTGKYQVSDKFEPEQLEASESYNKWLGNWRIENADGGYDITITADNPDVSYLISGWQADVFGNVGSAPSLTASFDVTTGDLVFSSQEDIANVTTNGEPCVLGFYGMNEAGSFYTGSYDIASASFDSESEGETAIVNGLSSDDVTFVAMMYFGLGETGNYAYSDPLYFPLTMTRVDEIQTKSVLNAGAAVRKVNSDKVFDVAVKSKATQAFFK